MEKLNFSYLARGRTLQVLVVVSKGSLSVYFLLLSGAVFITILFGPVSFQTQFNMQPAALIWPLDN